MVITDFQMVWLIIYNQHMLGQESTLFPKQIKIDDYADYDPNNVLSILESSNLLLGSGARTSTAAIVVAKALHFLAEERTLDLRDKIVLDLGCGVGFVGIYLACLGSQVILADLPSMKDLVERNIGINKSLLKRKTQFTIANWKKWECVGKCLEVNETNSTTSTQKQECLLHLMNKIDYTIICQGGNIHDLQNHLRWIGRLGLIYSFMERSYEGEDQLTLRLFQETLLAKQLNYQRLDQYHPDYVDERIAIFHIWK